MATRRAPFAAPRLIGTPHLGQLWPSESELPSASFLQLAPQFSVIEGNFNTDVPVYGAWAWASKLHIFLSLLWLGAMFFMLTTGDRLLWYQVGRICAAPTLSALSHAACPHHRAFAHLQYRKPDI